MGTDAFAFVTIQAHDERCPIDLRYRVAARWAFVLRCHDTLCTRRLLNRIAPLAAHVF
jgi:hypothetical protein